MTATFDAIVVKNYWCCEKIIEAISKNGFWPKIPALERRGRHGGREFQAGGIRRYFEDLKFVPNTDIGTKVFFEIASN
jgi:hypothetical protein